MFESAWANLLIASPEFFTPLNMLLLVCSVFFGVIIGAVPGFTASMGLTLFLPFTLGVSPVIALTIMIGIFVGGVSGGLVGSIILGIPGTPASVATVFDGHALMKRGEGGYALALAIWSSFFGGIISWLVLITMAPTLALIGLELGPWDFFMLMLFSLTIAASLAGDDLVKGLIAAGLGLTAAQIGTDPITSVARLTFGSNFMAHGFEVLPILVGLFAFGQLLTDLEDRKTAKRPMVGDAPLSFAGLENRRALKTIAKSWMTIVRSSLLGIFIGVVPALGASVSNLLAYDQAKKASKHPERFGKGEPEGVMAPECSNHADIGGSLTILMSLGIPGDSVAVVVLAAMMLHNVAPSPTFISEHPQIAYTIYLSYLLATVVTVLMQTMSLRLFMMIRWIPFYLLSGCILFCCAMGVFAWSNLVSDIWVMLIFGIVGYAMRLLGFPIAPFVLGVVLSGPTELNLIRAVSTSSDLSLFVLRPWAFFFLILIIFSLCFPIYERMRSRIPLLRFYYPLMAALLAIPFFVMGGWIRITIGLVLVAYAVNASVRMTRVPAIAGANLQPSRMQAAREGGAD